MRTLVVDQNNDPAIDEAGNLRFATGEQAVGIVAVHFVRALSGEMMFKADKGMPHFATALGVNVNLAQFEAAFRARMRELEDVISVRSFSATVRDGVLYYDATLETRYGLAQVSGNNSGIDGNGV